MPPASLAEALENEHRDIDRGVEAFAAALAGGPGDPEPLATALYALRRHIYLEEKFVFPPLGQGGMVAPLFVMLREHGQIWRVADELERQLAGAAVDPATLKELTVLLQHHNLKEEKIIYPEADRALPPAMIAELGAFLDSGRLPEGWVCAKARA